MSLATEGDYGDDLGHGYIRRPISVAQLLEREGYRPAARSRATRRALTGVAAGAVLALGAVVGSLLLNHAGNNTAGDTLASGSGGNEIVLGNHQPAVSTYPRNVAQQQIGTSASTTTPQSVSAPSTSNVQSHPQTPAGARQAVQNPVVPQSSRSATTTPATSTTQSTPTTSTTTTSPATGTSTNPPAQPAPAPTSSAPTNGNSNGGNGNSNNGGLLGTVTGTLTGTLNSVTQPVFNWFG